MGWHALALWEGRGDSASRGAQPRPSKTQGVPLMKPGYATDRRLRRVTHGFLDGLIQFSKNDGLQSLQSPAVFCREHLIAHPRSDFSNDFWPPYWGGGALVSEYAVAAARLDGVG